MPLDRYLNVNKPYIVNEVGMSEPWDIEAYRARAKQWHEAADACRSDKEREACQILYEGYASLVKLIEKIQASEQLKERNQ